MPERAIERLWESSHGRCAAARAPLLTPASLGCTRRSSPRATPRYDRGWLRARTLAAPRGRASGNLTVGGTGKTPVAAWIAARLAARGLQARRSCCADTAATSRSCTHA